MKKNLNEKVESLIEKIGEVSVKEYIFSANDVENYITQYAHIYCDVRICDFEDELEFWEKIDRIIIKNIIPELENFLKGE